MIVKGLVKKFDGKEVVRGIDLTVENGNVIAVIGSSGSGKTTILRCIDFFEKADAGTLEFAGKTYDLNRMKKKDIHDIRMQTSFVFQSFNLFANKTALDNVMAGLVYARKVSKQEAKEKALRALETVGLLDRAGHYPHQLSGG